MKRGWATFIFIVMIGLSIGISDPVFKSFVTNKLDFALTYYTYKAKHYYLEFTGQIKKPIISPTRHDLSGFELLCDAWILNKAEAKKLHKIFFDFHMRVRDKVFHDFSQRNPRPPRDKDGRKIGPEQRRFAGRLHEQVVDLFKQEIKNRKTENELAVIDYTIPHFHIVPDPALRALRFTPLKESQREALKPLAIELVKQLGTHQNEMGRPFRPVKPQNGDNRVAIEQARTALLNKVEEILPVRQKRIWEEKTEQAKKELEDMRKNIPPRFKQPNNQPKELASGTSLPVY